jgi:endonuclease/exonuclease/phosphatase family metal-dependent hydrolase
MRFRLVTYNIHKGIGGIDRLYRPDRIVETLRHYDPDVVFLQEVDDGVPRSQRHRQVDLLGDALDFPFRAFQRNVALHQGHYGNAILSRHPLSEVRSIDLSVPMKKRRQALAASCRLRGARRGEIQLINCHLGLAGFERRIQLSKILDSDVFRRAWQARTAIVVGGDFNDVWGTLGKRLLEPLGFIAACKETRTFPAMMPLRPLDRIYYHGVLGFEHSFPAHAAIARVASDHLPVIVDFRLA